MQLLKSKPAIDLGFRSDWFLREAAKSGRQSKSQSWPRQSTTHSKKQQKRPQPQVPSDHDIKRRQHAKQTKSRKEKFCPPKLVQPFLTTTFSTNQVRMWMAHVAQVEGNSNTFLLFLFLVYMQLTCLSLSLFIINRHCGDIVGATGLCTIRERT